MRRICVYAGSRSGSRPDYEDAARAVGSELARRQIGIVYGGAGVGVMGALADAALAEGGKVIGVAPRHSFPHEAPHTGLTEMRIVGSMHRRKAVMEDLSEGFIALPGGFGTLDELFETLTWAQIGLHQKPIGLLNVDGFYHQLLAFVDHLSHEGFIESEHRSLLIVERTPEALIDQLISRAAVTRKRSRQRAPDAG
ncbi:MAG TPA: TIGR00730 family Rossman fold protein [Ktedonobacterales bacterium]